MHQTEPLVIEFGAISTFLSQTFQPLNQKLHFLRGLNGIFKVSISLGMPLFLNIPPIKTTKVEANIFVFCKSFREFLEHLEKVQQCKINNHIIRLLWKQKSRN